MILSKTGKSLQPGSVHYFVSTLEEILPGRKIHPGIIRQSVIEELLKQGKDLRKVQTFTGHKKISATEEYKPSTSETLLKGLDKYHPLKKNFMSSKIVKFVENMDIMNLETRKINLISWLSHLQDEELISKIESIQGDQPDWWDMISKEERAEIEEGLAQLDRGEFTTHEKVMAKYKKWL